MSWFNSSKVETENIVYDNGYIKNGGFKVSSKFEGKVLQIKLEKHEDAWSDIGKVNSLGLVGFKRDFYIEKKQKVEVRIFNGPNLGKIFLG
jgi:hypothetical protein